MGIAVMKAFALAFIGTTFAPFAQAFWRMPCRSFPDYVRIDPIISPGQFSDHAHLIVGGSNFGPEATYEDLRASECTSCTITDDKSAYWVPAMMFRHANGTFEPVPRTQFLVYYQLFGQEQGEYVHAFPAGFQMISGDAPRRNSTVPHEPEKSLWGPEETAPGRLIQKAHGFMCLHFNVDPPEEFLARQFMIPKDEVDTNCPDGVRAELVFPGCWNGKDLTAVGGKSHVAYSSLIINGICPEDFPVRIPTLYYEAWYATAGFNGYDGDYVMSNGDPTGYGYHGDFMSGWDPDFLQQAIDSHCSDEGVIERCPLFTLQSPEEAGTCTYNPPAAALKEHCNFPGDKLCGDNPISRGPEPAIMNIHGGPFGDSSGNYPSASAPGNYGSGEDSSAYTFLTYSPSTGSSVFGVFYDGSATGTSVSTSSSVSDVVDYGFATSSSVSKTSSQGGQCAEVPTVTVAPTQIVLVQDGTEFIIEPVTVTLTTSV
ncbi:hypothetical protein EJ06DRAFT_320608 [Trichodelitschia bisporula]|uniref:DUF1996 domain-containing protein n=1 Tax=Trichodelitschia bisporula TaxID=703511 RepID=A0A6G1I486_9PEZI|nr:hypothetical protein EJ06DRAFT_320608 [Trichodelitschia bisporula]